MGLLFFLLTWAIGIFCVHRFFALKGLYLWALGWGVGIVGVTWLTYGLAWLSYLLGASHPISMSAYVALAVLLGFFLWLPKPALHQLKTSRRQLLWALAVLIFSSALMFSTFRVDGSHQVLVLDRLVFSDFAGHIPSIRSFSLGENLPPESPIFAGVPIRYHFMFYFFVGVLENLGLGIDWALNLTSTLGFGLFLVSIPFLIRHIFPMARMVSVGLGAVGLTLFSGTLLAFIHFPFTSWNLTSLWKSSFGRVDFLSAGPYYNWDQTITGLFWTLTIFTNQRHFGLGLAMGLFLFALALRPEPVTRPQAWFLGVLWGLFPLFHGLSFLSFMILFAGLWIWQKPKKSFTMFLVLASVIAAPQMLSLSPSNPEAAPSLHVGYALASDLSVLRFLNYWFQNIGVKILLIPILFFWWKGTPRRVLILSSVLFLLPNLVKFGPEIYTNHKFFNLWLVFVNMFVAKWLCEIWGKPLWRRGAVLILAFSMTFSGWFDLFPIFNDTTVRIEDWKADPIARYIKKKTSPDDVFATSYSIYHPVHMTGRKVLLGWPYFSWSAGYSVKPRKEEVERIFETSNAKERCRILNRLNARYVVVGKAPQYSEPYTPTLEEVTKELRTLTQDRRYVLLDALSSCSAGGSNSLDSAND